MKSIAISLLLIFYVVSATGFSVKVHYCGGNISSISFNLNQDFCKKCGKKSMKDCCSDKTLSYKLASDQQIDIEHIKINKAAVLLFDFKYFQVSSITSDFYIFSKNWVHHPSIWLKTKFIFFVHSILI